MSSEFVHLHVHTIHSHLDSTITIQALIDQAVAFSMPAVAITDYANLDGADEFMRKCYEADIKPIVGCEMFVVDDIRSSFSVKPSFRLLLLCKNRAGLRNLRELVAFANNEGFHHKPRIDKNILKCHADGLIALSACMRGEIPYFCLRGQYDEAVDVAKEYAAIFPNSFYIELQENAIPEQNLVNKALLKIAAELSLPIVATNDCHYLAPDEAVEHEKLMCEQTGKSMSDPTHMRCSVNDFYFKPAQEMINAFKHLPEAIENTGVIADQCNVVTPTTGMTYAEYSANEEYHERAARIREAVSKGVSAVGIFWLLPGMKLEYYSLPYTEGYEEGDYITAGIKYESNWNSLKRCIQQLNGDLKEFANEYDHFPRGSVEYNKQSEAFVINVPEIVINSEKAMDLIKSVFRLERQTIETINTNCGK